MAAKRKGRVNIVIPKIWSVVIILAATYLIILAIFYFSQGSFIYFPYKDIVAEPKHIGLKFLDVYLTAKDGIKLSGWYIPKEQPKGIVLFCHGNAGNISHRLDSIQTFNHLGLSVFIFDYRGYGRSSGRPSEAGTYMDAEAAWDYIINELKYQPENVIIFGRSLGGAIASWLAKEKSPAGLISESAFSSIGDIGSELYPFLPVRLLAKFDYNAKEYISKANCPVLIVHSRQDDIIPFRHGQRIFKAAKEPKEFLEISGSHNEGFILSAAKYEEGLSSFIKKSLKRAKDR